MGTPSSVVASTRAVGIVPGARENEQTTEVLSELAEIIRLDTQLGQNAKESDRFTLLLTIISRLKSKAAARLRVEPVKYAGANGDRRVTGDWLAWRRGRDTLRRIDQMLREVPIPSMTTPEPVPIPTPSGTKYVFRMAGQRTLGTIFAEDVPNVLGPLLDREDQKAFYRANMKLWQARDLAWQLVSELRIIHEGTLIPLRVPSYSDAEADTAERSLQGGGYAAASRGRRGGYPEEDDEDEEIDDEEDEDDLPPIPYAGDD